MVPLFADNGVSYAIWISAVVAENDIVRAHSQSSGEDSASDSDYLFGACLAYKLRCELCQAVLLCKSDRIIRRDPLCALHVRSPQGPEDVQKRPEKADGWTIVSCLNELAQTPKRWPRPLRTMFR